MESSMNIFNRWGLLVLIIGIAVFQFFMFHDTKNSILTDVYNVVTIWGIIYTALVASHDYFQGCKLREKFLHVERNERKLERAIHLCDFMDDEHLRVARDITRKLRDNKDKMDDKDLINLINFDDNSKRSVINMFNYWERVGLAIDRDMADSDYLQTYLGDVFISQYDRFRPWHEEYFKQHNLQGKATLEKLYKEWGGDK